MKAAIYLRTSTTEQDPENQKEACLAFAKMRGYEVSIILQEKLSGFKKDIERPFYNSIKEMAHEGKINAVIVWALDRWVRNRDTLLDDITTLRSCGCKLHSVQESWLEAVNIEGGLGKTIQDFLLGLIGSIAEMESLRKSERVKIAYEKVKKESRKNNKWGRRELPERVLSEVKDLRKKGHSVRDIAKSVSYYDKNRNLRNLSVGSVSNIINRGN